MWGAGGAGGTTGWVPSAQTRSWYNCGKTLQAEPRRGLSPSSTISGGQDDHFLLTDPNTGTKKGCMSMGGGSPMQEMPAITGGGLSQVIIGRGVPITESGTASP